MWGPRAYLIVHHAEGRKDGLVMVCWVHVTLRKMTSLEVDYPENGSLCIERKGMNDVDAVAPDGVYHIEQLDI